MVITLLCTLLLAALIFYVMNLGRQTSQRMLTQHSADAAVSAGAGWVARTFNTIAMNNVSMARLIALCNVMDSMPLAVSFTQIDQTALRQAVQEQLSRGVSQNWVRDSLQQVEGELATELEILAPLNQVFNDTGSSVYYDVTQTTFYDGPNGRGHAWDAMAALDAYNQAAAQNMGVLAQLNAIRGGEVNLVADDPDAGALLLPLLPTVAVQRGHFNDFQRPVMYGLLRRGLDDEVTNRGPYDTVYGQRDMHRTGGSGGVGYGGNVPGIGQGGGGGGYTPGEPTRYRVYGPQEAMIRRFHGANLRQSQFANGHLRRLAEAKRAYLWPGSATASVVQPQWVIDWTQATGIAAANPGRIVQTRFVIVEIKSAYPRNHAQFLSPGTWVHIERNHPTRNSPRTAYVSGWMDPRTWTGGVQKVDDHIWLDSWTYQRIQDPTIGLEPVYDQDGQPVPHTVYRYDHFMFAGVNVGTPVEVRNPHNFVDRDSLPAPTDVVPQSLPNDGLGQPAPLPFMAVAHRHDRALLWPSRFTGDKPAPGMVAVAGAAVFNDHSLDLWTQMWHAQVSQINQTQYDQWLTSLESTLGDAEMLPVLDPQEVSDLLTYLKSVQPLSFMLSH